MEKKNFADPHPIQLLKIDIRELYFRANASADPLYELPEELITLGVGHSDIDKNQGIFTVGIQLELGKEKSKKNKYYARLELLGHFHIDLTRFSEGKIDVWTQQNAPVILLPYLREHIYSMTMRAGFKPFILPLVQVPTR